MPANYVLLERIELNASAASVSFTNIPQSGYTDLKIVASARTDRTGSYEDAVRVQFNASGGTAYSTRRLYGNGSVASSNSDSGAAYSTFYSTSDAANTANTFGNFEIYVPNYSSTTANKSISVDMVSENNATDAIAGLGAGLWASTAAINQVTLTPNSGTVFLQYSTFSLYGLAAVGTTPVIAPKASGGSRITTDGTYWYHTFLSTGAFVPQISLSCDVLTVAGGGAGSGVSGGWGAAGGAGGLVYLSSQSLTAGTYSATVGAGGAGAANGTQPANGSNSQLGSLTAAVGGGGAGVNGSSNGSNGGSGGGANLTGTGGSGTSGQGNAGGSGDGGSNQVSGGGGGATAAGNGGSGSNAYGGAGSSAYSSWGSATGTGENVSGTYWYAGGGGGALANGSQPLGGNGGGGDGSQYNSGATQNNGTAGTANTGGGGGGNVATTSVNGKSGGSGIIIIRYPIA